MTPSEEPREREIGAWTKRAIIAWLLTGIFGVVIVIGGTRPESFYLGMFLLGINMIIIILYMFWWVASKADDFIGRKLD